MEPTVTPDVAEWIVDQLRERMVEGDETQIAIVPKNGALHAMVNWRPVLNVPLKDNPLGGTTAPA